MEYDSKADIWSLGITALEMADGKPPYSGIQSNIVVFRITTKTPPFFQNPNDWSPTFTDFVMKCLQKNPGNRSEASEMMEHDFIKDAEAVNGLDHLLREALANKPNDEELNCVEHLKRWLVGKYGRCWPVWFGFCFLAIVADLFLLALCPDCFGAPSVSPMVAGFATISGILFLFLMIVPVLIAKVAA